MISSMRNRSRTAGFTLIEVMITVAIVAILAAVALPSYNEYVLRSRLVEAKTNLTDMRTRLEQYFLDNRTYPTGGCITYASGAAPAGKIYKPASIKNFAIDCGTPTATAYTVTATGLGFTFTINESNVRKTTAKPSGWTLPSTDCWVSRKNGDC